MEKNDLGLLSFGQLTWAVLLVTVVPTVVCAVTHVVVPDTLLVGADELVSVAPSSLDNCKKKEEKMKKVKAVCMSLKEIVENTQDL